MIKKEYTGITALQKGSFIHLTATDPDLEEHNVTIPEADIMELFGFGTDKWMELNGDRESSLWELFNSVAGIAYAD